MKLTKQDLIDFLATPSQNSQTKDQSEKAQLLFWWIENHPLEVIEILNTHPYIAASFLLDELVVKAQQANGLVKLVNFFTKHNDLLIQTCVYNEHDRLRFMLSRNQVYFSPIVQSLELYLAASPRVKKGLFAGHYPRVLRELKVELDAINQRPEQLLERMECIRDLAKQFSPNHPLRRALNKCKVSEHTGYAK